MEKTFLNVNECADFLGISKQRVYEMTMKREIPFYKLGKRVRFNVSDLRDWMESKRVEMVY